MKYQVNWEQPENHKDTHVVFVRTVGKARTIEWKKVNPQGRKSHIFEVTAPLPKVAKITMKYFLGSSACYHPRDALQLDQLRHCKEMLSSLRAYRKVPGEHHNM